MQARRVWWPKHQLPGALLRPAVPAPSPASGAVRAPEWTGEPPAGGEGGPAEDALELRERLRALAAVKSEAFGMIEHHLGGNHRLVGLVTGASRRLPFLIFLLGDLAWVLGERNAHAGDQLAASTEVEGIKRVFIAHAHTRRLYPMTESQLAAVLDYLDALLAVAARTIALDEHAPSRRLAREAGALTEELAHLRGALTSP